MWRSRWRCVIKPAYSVSFLLSINNFVWQNVLYFPNDLRIFRISKELSKSSRKVPVIFVRFYETWIFFDRFSKKYSNIKFNKNRSSGSRDVPCGERDRRTDMTKLTVSFRNFANAPNNVHRWLQSDSRVTNRTCFLSPRNYKISKCVQVSDYWRFGAWVTVTYLRTRRIIFEVLSATECTKTMFWKLTMY